MTALTLRPTAAYRSTPRPTQLRQLEVLIEAALDAGHDVRLRRQRRDGWTPERIRIFLTLLSQEGKVARAARAVGMSRKGAYALRSSAKGYAFAAAWDAAVRLAGERRMDRRPSRVLHGVLEPIVRNGKLWGLRHRFDNRAARAALPRLDRTLHATDPLLPVIEDFDSFVAVVVKGGQAADALMERVEQPHQGQESKP
jgi:hypothetical protein